MRLHLLGGGEELGAEAPTRRLDHDPPAVEEPHTVHALHAAREELVAVDPGSERAGTEPVDQRGDALGITGPEDVLIGLAGARPIRVALGDRGPAQWHRPSMRKARS
jgi:hypothetical protein